MGPKTIALFWSAAKITSIDQLAEAIDAGHLAKLPRMGAKRSRSLKKALRIIAAALGASASMKPKKRATRIANYLLAFDGIDSVTPAGSLRRGRETAGDLDLLVTGSACQPGHSDAAVEYVAAYPGIHSIIAKGENKVSFYLGNSLQVDVRLLPSESYGAALQYFTGSKAHNVSLRQRALKMGYTLSEWSLARLDDDSTVAAATEEEIYAALGMDWMPRSCARTSAKSKPPPIVPCPASSSVATSRATCTCTPRRRRAQLHPRNGRGRSRRIPVRRHHRPLEKPGHDNGLDEARALEHIKRIREVDKRWKAAFASSPESKSTS